MKIKSTITLKICPAKNCHNDECQGHYFPPLKDGLRSYAKGHIDGTICGCRTIDEDIEGGIEAFVKKHKFPQIN